MTAKTIDTDAPLLRAPPFPAAKVVVSRVRPSAGPPLASDMIDRVFATIREQKVGGAFWLRSAGVPDSRIVVRISSMAEAEPLLATMSDADRIAALWLLPADVERRAVTASPIHPDRVIFGEADPWSVLSPGGQLHAHGNDEWVALAHIAGCRVAISSRGRFGAPGADPAQLRANIAGELSRFSYLDPFTGEDADIDATIAQLGDWRRIFAANRGIVAACGMAWWKRHEMARFLGTPEHDTRFFRSERRALRYAARKSGAIAIWPSRISHDMVESARLKDIPLVRVEDGFVRSVGLGANLVPPSSITVDRVGIHYDCDRPSELEQILSHASFPEPLLARAQRLRQTILDAGISKYGSDAGHAGPARVSADRIVLVPGQVEDDMSVRLGGGGLSSNLEILRRARKLEPDAEIWFRPHPDVDAGHRKGAVRDADARQYADRVVRGGGMAGLLETVDAVHVLTSLTGFEALLRGREVTCHGTPFYAGWGLTCDLGPMSDRRGRQLTLDQLVAAVLILYPRYLDPETGLPCPPETLVDRIARHAAHNRLGWITRGRQFQGRLMRFRQ